jgi:hypothetical protein
MPRKKIFRVLGKNPRFDCRYSRGGNVISAVDVGREVLTVSYHLQLAASRWKVAGR